MVEKDGGRKHIRVFVACAVVKLCRWFGCAALVVGSVGKSNGDQFRFSSRTQCSLVAAFASDSPLLCTGNYVASQHVSLLQYIAGVAWTEVLMEFLSRLRRGARLR